MVEQVSDFKMPEKIVARLLKDALPEDVVISKEAKNVACRSASVFILHLSIMAAEKASANKRRNLDTRDIIQAATELGLGEHAPQLVRFQAQRKRNAKRKVSNIQKSRSRKASGILDQHSSSTVDLNGTETGANMGDSQDQEREDQVSEREDCTMSSDQNEEEQNEVAT